MLLLLLCCDAFKQSGVQRLSINTPQAQKTHQHAQSRIPTQLYLPLFLDPSQTKDAQRGNQKEVKSKKSPMHAIHAFRHSPTPTHQSSHPSFSLTPQTLSFKTSHDQHFSSMRTNPASPTTRARKKASQKTFFFIFPILRFVCDLSL
jgi:hypothetical protein